MGRARMLGMHARQLVLWQLSHCWRRMQEGVALSTAIARDRLTGSLMGAGSWVHLGVHGRFRGTLCGTHAWRLILFRGPGLVTCMHAGVSDEALCV